MPSPPIIRPARPADLPDVLSLLTRAGLPHEGVREHLQNFLVAEVDGRLSGVIGLEVYGETGLLRSAAVEENQRGLGIGASLCDALMERARALGVRELVLLTNTAAAYFARRGFVEVARTSVTGPVTTSVEFSEVCPSHSTCMVKKL